MAGIQDRDGAIRLLAALRARFSTISLVWADGGYAGRLIDWSKWVVSLTVQVVKRTDDVKRVQGSSPALGSRANLRLDLKTPPMRPRLRNPARPPRSDGLHRHDRHHVTPPRPHGVTHPGVLRRALSRLGRRGPAWRVPRGGADVTNPPVRTPGSSGHEEPGQHPMTSGSPPHAEYDSTGPEHQSEHDQADSSATQRSRRAV
ncbi:hypothetical protein [Rhodococcus oxybenzonivorans]|uniref:hypothetical protein n=1 Tax=Rhodococcus oxybenzonivorans TaxID=1990687 RepID=UPI003001D8A4